MFTASLLTVAFLLAGLSAYRLLRGDRKPEVTAVLRSAIVLAAILTPLQIFLGDQHGLNTLEHQPAKIAAIEAIWETEQGVPLTLIGLPNEQTRHTDYAVTIPKLASLILAHDADAILVGLNDFEHHPPVAPIFWSFRVMVGIGILMLVCSCLGAWQLWHRRRRELPLPTWLLRTFSLLSFSGWLAVLAGWYTTEIGRQPWLVQGVLSTQQAASALPAPMIGLTLALYLSLYLGLIIAYISVVFYLARKAVHQQGKIHLPAASGPPVMPLPNQVPTQ